MSSGSEFKTSEISSESEFVFHSSELPNKSYPYFDDMRRKGKLCDITFKVGDHSISAHRIILAAGIPYFRDTIYSDSTIEALEKEIEIPEINHSAFDALIEFVYTCKISITIENVKDLLMAACALHVDEVWDACCEYVADRLHPETALDVRNCVRSLGCASLVETIDRYVRKNFDEVSLSESFSNLSLTDLKEFISRDDIQVSSEEKVFEAVMYWIKKSPLERSVELPKLLKDVRMTLLKPRYLSDYVAAEDLIRRSIPCRDLLDEARDYHLFPEKRQELLTFCTEPRYFVNKDEIDTFPLLQFTKRELVEQKNCESRKDKMVGICKVEAKTICSVQCFDSERNEWHTYEPRTIYHNNGSAAEMNGKIYMFLKLFTLEYDPRRKDVHFYKGASTRFTGAATLDGEIYICGGIDSIVDTFDPNTKEWTVITHMLSRRNFVGVVALGECVYILGGVKKRRILRGIESYNVGNECWTDEKPMLTSRYALGCATLNDRIYVCGGMSETGCLSTAEVFDPTRNEWEFISSMNTPRMKHKLLPYCGKLYALGGEDAERRVLNTIEIYDPITDEWIFGPPMDSDIKLSGAVVILQT